MLCKRRIAEHHQPTGPALAPAPNQSHGICLDCFPGYARSFNLTQQQIDLIQAQAHD